MNDFGAMPCQKMEMQWFILFRSFGCLYSRFNDVRSSKKKQREMPSNIQICSMFILVAFSCVGETGAAASVTVAAAAAVVVHR